jgi:hypothetical protein
MGNLTTFEVLFDNRVRDAAARFTTAQKDDAIGQAVKRYTSLRPVEGVQDYAGDGAIYDLALPTGYVEGISTVRSIEYPQGQRQPTFIMPKDWVYYRSPTALKIRILVTTPTLGNTVRVAFTKPHTVDAGGSTIPVNDEEAVSDLAAAIGLRELASIYAGTTDPTIAADSVNYRTKAQEYSMLSDKLESRWRTHMGLDKDSESQAATGFADMKSPDSLGLDRLTHPSRFRDE